ncbi:MAG TPA: amino acid ABC transporter permease [Candidatus Babeliales bacterium]|nr:amino acid ABC transporter permease [Candidatus Babeliales bacterium]
MIIDFNLIIEYAPVLLQGLVVTLQIAAAGCCIGLVLGTILALMQTSHNTLLRLFVNVYVVIIRGTPMLIQILCAYFLLPQIGIHIPAFWTAIIAIGLNSAAYISQVIRSGISSVGIGQVEAAKVLGFSTADTIRYIVLPQALRTTLPALGNEFVTLIKDSALASLIGVSELTKQANFVKSKTFDAITVYFAVAILYLILTSTVSFLVARLEKRMNIHAQD